MATPRTDNRPYCPKHDTHYSALKPCAGCAADPAPTVSVASDNEAPADPELAKIEAMVSETMDEIRKRASEWLRMRRDDGNKDSIGESTGVKLYDVLAKFTNIKIGMVEARARRQYMRDLMAHEQIMAGVRKAH